MSEWAKQFLAAPIRKERIPESGTEERIFMKRPSLAELIEIFMNVISFFYHKNVFSKKLYKIVNDNLL